MNITLDYLRGHRSWLVRNFRVWGDYFSVEASIIFTESTSGAKRILLGRAFLGGLNQEVTFSDEVRCFQVGSENSSGFRIAKDEASKTGLVDLWIVEMS
ncbi:MAG: hypothetical protein AMJ41_05290 [candidate division Zixibacteria bacterium DG_27]|nr:MAG: hypothetical protein AMJ41_05290 [candidate division Zixibacteria bacterium DG_27]